MYIHSNGCLNTFPANTGGRFSNSLQNPLILEGGNWEVGLSSIICNGYNLIQLMLEHQNIVLHALDTDKPHLIHNWKSY